MYTCFFTLNKFISENYLISENFISDVFTNLNLTDYSNRFIIIIIKI